MDALCPLVESSTDTAHDHLTLGAILRGFLPALLQLLSKRWVLYAKCPFGGPPQVLSYLANYTHRVALTNRRIVAVDAQHQTVTFTYRDCRGLTP